MGKQRKIFINDFILVCVLTAFGLLAVVCGFGCAHLSEASERVVKAQQYLAAVRPKVERLLQAYDRKTEERIAQCEEQDLETAAERRECLGPFAPDSLLSVNIANLRHAYNHSADDLKALRLILEIVETHEDVLELKDE